MSETSPTPEDRGRDELDDGAAIELARRAISMIDLTDLSDTSRADRSGTGIEELCRRAAEHGTAAVCVWPIHVAHCASLLGATSVSVATVVNFPQGDQPVGKVLEETLTALGDGADEIDVVMPYKMFRNGDVQSTASLIQAVGDLVAPPGLLKVILETGELSDDALIRSAADLAIGLGADFVKTSTGKSPTSATLGAARLLLDAIAEHAMSSGRAVGIKPSGGIGTFDAAVEYLDLCAAVMGPGWATPATFRFGASSLLDALLAVLH